MFSYTAVTVGVAEGSKIPRTAGQGLADGPSIPIARQLQGVYGKSSGSSARLTSEPHLLLPCYTYPTPTRCVCLFATSSACFEDNETRGPTMINISCLCGAARQTVSSESSASLDIALCHCHSCRHQTGLLCTSYVPILPSSPLSLDRLSSHASSATSVRYFCSTCGCHVFRRAGDPSSPRWEVATGVITTSPEIPTVGPSLPRWRHLHSDDSIDGGLAPFLSDRSTVGFSLTTGNPIPAPFASFEHEAPNSGGTAKGERSSSIHCMPGCWC